MQNVDDWIRQMSSTNTAMHSTIPPSTSPSQSELRFDPNLMESFHMLDEFLNSQLQLQPQHDGGRSPPQCQCQPGLCTCGHSGAPAAALDALLRSPHSAVGSTIHAMSSAHRLNITRYGDAGIVGFDDGKDLCEPNV